MKQKHINFELLFDNGGGITLITPDYCHFYDRADWAAADVVGLLNGANTSNWDGNEPEFRRDRHPEDDVMTAAMARSIREGGPWKQHGHAWDEFCAALAPSMTQDELLLAERAADTLVDLIRFLESRDPNHPEIANLNKIYGEILNAAVRHIPRVNIGEVG